MSTTDEREALRREIIQVEKEWKALTTRREIIGRRRLELWLRAHDGGHFSYAEIGELVGFTRGWVISALRKYRNREEE